MSAALSISAAWAIVSLFGIVVMFVGTLTSNDIFLGSLPVNISTHNAPCLGDLGPGATTVQGCTSAADISATVSGLPPGLKALVAASQATPSLLAMIPALALAIICFQTIRGLPFTRLVTRTLVVTAIAVLVVGIADSLLSGISQGLVAAHVLPGSGSTARVTAGDYNLSVPLWPFGASLAILALAAVFRFGGRLQRETEGLV